MVDDFSKYTWVEFLHKREVAPQIIVENLKKLEKGLTPIVKIKSDNGT